MLSRFFINNDLTVGIRLAGPESLTRLPNDKMFTQSARTSLKIRLAWPNYPTKTLQVQYRGTTHGASGPIQISIRRFAELAQNAVTNYMLHAEEERREENRKKGFPLEYVEHPQWRIGIEPGQISRNNVSIIGAYFMSEGIVMLILKVD